MHVIRTVQETFRPIFNLGDRFPVDGSQFDHLFAEDEIFAIGDIAARVIPVPGHTSDSVAYLIGDALFTGDSLFMPDGGTARCDFPGGSAQCCTGRSSACSNCPTTPASSSVTTTAPAVAKPPAKPASANRNAPTSTSAPIGEAEYVQLREARDPTLAMPALIIPSVQANIRAGALPEAEDNGVRYFKIPLDLL